MRDYKAASGGDPTRLGSSSPFNIKEESLLIRNFTEAEMRELYGQHTAETGQVFTEEALRRAWELGQGQPWITNALAREVMEQERTKQPYASVVSWGPTPFPRGGIVNGVAVETTFSVQSQVTVMDTSPPFNRSLLRVVVSWDEGSAGAANITREVQLETFVVEY